MSSLADYGTLGEGKIARRLVKNILGRGYSISVNDGEEWTVRRSTNAKEITDALCTTGEDHLAVYAADGERIGWFCLIYGNAEDGSELISDYSANALCDEIWREVYPELA